MRGGREEGGGEREMKVHLHSEFPRGGTNEENFPVGVEGHA